MSDTEEAGPSAVSMPAQMATYAPVCRLTDSNYQAWALKMEMALKRESLWRYISDPPLILSGEHKLKDERAQALIVLSMDDDLLVHVRGLDTAKKCWDALKTLYVRESVASKITLSRRLYRARLEPGGSLRDHLRMMQQLFYELAAQGMDIPEFQKALTVLSSLDSSWDTFALTLETVPEQILTFAYLSSRLLEEDDKRRENAAVRGKASTKAAAAPKHTPVSSEEVTQVHAVRRRCFRCASESHLARDCPRKAAKKGKKPPGQPKYQASMVTAETAEKEAWLVDSGTNHNIACNPQLFQDLQSAPRELVCLANGRSESVAGKGDVYVQGLKICLEDVLYVPNLRQNLLSVASMTRQGFTVTFKDGQCIFSGQGRTVVVPERHGTYILDGSASVSAGACFLTRDPHVSCQHTWHKRLAHVNLDYVAKTAELARGVQIKDCGDFVACDACAEAKSQRAPLPRSSKRQSKSVLDLIHMDLAGPLTPSLGQARYIFLLVDDHSRFSFVILLKQKSQAFEAFRKWLTSVERSTGRRLRAIQSDRGGEFCGSQMRRWLEKRGIVHRTSAPFSPQQNGVAERILAHIQTMKDTVMAGAGLSKGTWGEVLLTCNYLRNRTFSKAIDTLPYVLWFKRSPDLSFLRAVGCKAWVHIVKQNRRKGDPRAQKCTFVGYEPNSKSYRFLCQDGRTIVVSRSAKFLENEQRHKQGDVYLPVAGPMAAPAETEPLEEEGGAAATEPELTPSRQAVAPKPETASPIKIEGGASPQRGAESPQRRVFLRSNRGVPPERFMISNMVNAYVEPENYRDVCALPESEKGKWFAAMEEEIQAMKRLGVFEWCELPEGKKPIGCRWVYKIKSKDQMPIYKARLVAQGFSQQKWVNYAEVFSPTLAAASVRILFTVAAHKGLEAYHMDVERAYLHAPLEEEVFMHPPPGFDSEPGKKWRLKKALYGLKQAGRLWNRTFDAVVKKMGFVALRSDPCVYKMNSELYMTCYVDDVILYTRNEQKAQEIAQKLGKHFKVKFLGKVKNYLGVEVERTEKGFSLCQKQKILQLLERWSMSNARSAQTPMELDCKKGAKAESDIPWDTEQYQSLLGSLLHISLWTRPDVALSTARLGRFAADPKQEHWVALKRVLRYLKTTVDYKLCLQPVGPLVLQAYADSDWAGSQDRKSTSGMAIVLGGSLVDWRSRRQSIIALSSCESEYGAVSDVIKELVWHKQMLTELDFVQPKTLDIFEDNESCIALARSERVHGRSKHVDIRYQNVKDSVQNKDIQLVYCPSDKNLADIFTKPMTKIKHQKCVGLLGMTTV